MWPQDWKRSVFIPVPKKSNAKDRPNYCTIALISHAFWLCGAQQTWKILQEMRTPDHLTCLLRSLYASQEATVRTGHETTDWFQIGKGIHQGCISSPCLFNLYAEYIMRNAGLMKHKLESRLLGEISITSDMQMTPPLWHHHPLDESEKGEWKSWLKTQHSKN